MGSAIQLFEYATATAYTDMKASNFIIAFCFTISAIYSIYGSGYLH